MSLPRPTMWELFDPSAGGLRASRHKKRLLAGGRMSIRRWLGFIRVSCKEYFDWYLKVSYISGVFLKGPKRRKDERQF